MCGPSAPLVSSLIFVLSAAGCATSPGGGESAATSGGGISFKCAPNLNTPDPCKIYIEKVCRTVAPSGVQFIDSLIRETEEAGAVDLADNLGISHVTVSKTV